MNPQVERLEALLARVQHNRKLPRTPGAAAPVANVADVEPLAAKLDAAPSLDAVVDDAVIVAETKIERPAPPPVEDVPVLELEPHAPKAEARAPIDELDDPGVEPLPELEPIELEPAAPAQPAAAPVARTEAEPVVASAASVAVEDDDDVRTEPPPAPAASAGIAPVPVTPTAHAAPSGPIIKVAVPQPASAAISFGELVRRSIALRPI